MDVFGGAPRFLAYPRPVVVQSGTDAVLKCQIGGDPRPAVIWEQNNEKIDPQGRYRVFEDGNVYNLIISAVTTEDSGQYICKAKNSIGETYAAASLKVEGEAQEMELREENKPRFLIKPLSTRAGRGEDAVFSCKLWGNPRPEVVWEKDGRKLNEIFESTHFSVGYQDGGWFQLKIFKTRAPDGGVYTCKARNEFGEALAGAVLLVDAGPGHEEEGNRNGYTNGQWKAHQGKQRSSRPVLNRLKDDTITKSTKVKMFAVTEGKHAKFRCFVTGKPKPEIIWRKDGRLILSGRRYLLYEDREGYFTLKVLYCKQKDNGVYVCAASNTAGQTLSAVHLSVKEPPVRFKQPLIDLEVWEQDLAVLECEVPEDSVPITWYLEDRRLQPGAKYGMEEWGTKRRLTIRDIGVDDDGIYLCEMPDGGRSIAEVAVRGTILRKLPRKVDVLEGENAAFCVEVDKEEMDIHWYKDGTELRETHQTILKSFGRTHILVFVNTMPQDSGLVTFLVGRSKTSSQLRVKAARHCPPSCPVGVQINTERANAALLSWIPAQDSRRNPPSGYVLERQEVGTGSQEWLQCLTTDSATSVEILGDSVPCEADYRFRICSVNKYGKSNNVEFPRAVHLVPVARIQAPLQDALVPEGQDALFSIELSASVIGTWFLNGTQLQEDEKFSMRRTRTHQSLRIRSVRDTDNGAEITFIAYGIRDSAALYIQAPLVKFSPLSEMDRNKFVEVGNPIVLYCELSDPTAPVHWYKNGMELQTMEGLHIQSEGTMRRIVIQSAEFSHSGVYCCDAIDDVIRFNVEVEAIAPTNLLGPVEKSEAAEAHCPIVQQFEISDPIAKACWYKDGTQIYPKRQPDCESRSSCQALPLQPNDIWAADEQFSCESPSGAQLDVNMKAEQHHYRDDSGEIDEVADASAQYSVEIKAATPRLSSGHDKNESTVEAFCTSSKCNSGIVMGQRDTPTYEDHSKQTPPSQSTFNNINPWMTTVKPRDPSNNQHPTGQYPINCSSATVKSEHKLSDTQCFIKCPTQSAGEDIVCCGQPAEALTEELGASQHTAIQTHGLGNVLQTAMFRPRRLQPEESAQLATTWSVSDTPLETLSGQSGKPMNHLHVSAVQPDQTCNKVKTETLQSEKSNPVSFTALATTTIHSEMLLNSLHESTKAFQPLQTTYIQPEELCSALHMMDVLSLNCLQPKTVNLDYPCNTSWTKTKQSEQLNPRTESEKLFDLAGIVCPQPMDSHEAKEPEPVQLGQSCNFLQPACSRVGDLCPTDQAAAPDLSDMLRQSMQAITVQTGSQCAVETTEEQAETTLLPPSKFTVPHYIQQEAPSEEIYLSRTCDSHWSDSVTADKVAVEAPPVTIAKLCEAEKNKSVEVGETIALQCEISDPNAQVTWCKDGVKLLEAAGQQVLAEGSVRSLSIQPALLSHAGTYNCTTTDDTVQFRVEVKAPLQMFASIADADQRKTVMAGCPISLQCELSNPTGQVSWYKDGTELLPQSGVHIQSEGNFTSLVVPSAQQAHAGMYRCESEDDDIQFDVGAKAQHVKLSELEESDRKQTVQEGASIVLSCKLSHDPSTHVSWYKDGMKLLPQNNVDIQSEGLTRTLRIQSAESKHSGTYECSTSADTLTFSVEVKGRAPKIRPVPLAEKYRLITVGCPMILQCEVSDPLAQVSWFKDEVELFCKTGLDMKRDGGIRKLMINSAKASDSGIYCCSLAGDAVTFHVDVEATPVRFSALPEVARNKFVEAGCPITLQCEVSEPTAQVYWHKDRQQLPPHSEYEVHKKEKLRALVIQSAEVRHTGLYSCEAADDHIEFKVDVAAVPEAEGNKSVEAGSLVSLQGDTSDTARQATCCEDEIELWPYSGMNVESKAIKGTLLTKTATSFCSESNGGKTNDDSDFQDVCVEVKAPPVSFADVPEDNLYKSVAENEQLVLSCEVSRADGSVQWYKDGSEIQAGKNVTIEAEGTRRSLTVHFARLSDAGTYTCRTGDNVLIFKVNVREPPVMIIYPKEDVHLDRHVPEEIILSCELSRPSGVISWYKDGQKLQESENIKLKIEGPYRRLKILSSGVEDSGEYVCDTADDSIFFHLSVTEPPVRIVSPSQSQMELCQQTSERMVLSCEISRPNATVRWYRDGLEVEENDNLLLEVDGVYRRLIIPETTVKDSAEYVCDTADDSMTFFVNIAEPPVRFVRPRKSASRLEKVVGESLVLDCEVSRANAEVTWKKNKEEVENSRNVTILEDGVVRQLTIHSVMVEDAGQYVCDAKDDVMDFHVMVQELPVKILGKTEAKTEKQFFVSDDIILVCELSRSNASVSWFKDSQLIANSERYCSEEQGVFRSLVVLNAGLEDSGEYTCDAADDKIVFYITVREPPVQIVGNSGHPEHHILVAGDDLILECEVSRPNAAVQWLRNGQVLEADTRIRIHSCDVTRKLVLSGLQPSDSGKYICDAIDDKLVTIVEVQDLPAKFVNKTASNSISACENESVTLCAVVSHDRAPVRWLKDGRLLDQDNIHISSEDKTHKLTINPLQLSDSGEYVCDVKTDEMYFSLLVKEMKATFVRRLENTVALEGRSLTLRCELSKPKGDVQWLKDGNEVRPSRRHTIRAQGRERSFTIHQTAKEDAGEYACESTHDRTSASVVVEPPRVVEFIAELRSITVREGEDAVFKCVVSPEDTRLVWRLNGQQAARNERAVISSNGLCHMLCIHRCLVSDSGRVTADAEGVVSKAELQVQEQQVLFTKGLTAVTAEEHGDALLEVEVSVDSGEVQWMRQGVLIHPDARHSLKHSGRTHSLAIHQLAVSDRGAYSCETLHDRTQAQLSVEPRKVSLKRGLKDIRTTERETASFEVELSHSNVPGTWIRNGIRIKPTSHFRVSAQGPVHSLSMSNLSVEDTGTFTFCADNVRTSARLVVKEPPVTIFRGLEDQRFPEGAFISIECELSRHNVDVRWMKNGLEMKPGKDVRIYAMGRKRFLQIMKCHVGDSGTYTCDAGDASTSCTMEVYERELLILQGLDDLDIQEDQNAVFVCEVSVEDVPGEWYRNGERIQPTSTIKIRQEGTKHFLLMCNVRAEDSGEIKFVARHVESVACLDVEELPVNIVKPLQDKTALERTRVVLECTVSNPRSSIRWYQGSSVILPSEHFEICSEGCYRKLIIQQVALDDEGTYSVQVGDFTCSAHLTVEAQPVLMVRQLGDVQVPAPEEASFECEVSVPSLKAAVWSLNGQRLDPSSRVRVNMVGTVHRLTLLHTSLDMSGVVEFTAGEARSRAQLLVLGDS
ncbi:obscurin-like protein 1 isoform X10 [Betta splendens]|uniref:Obscurin-like protein 1 n=1 Tax=Betta splendens TaxID=158456 RepID=A0A8M1H864_BETSP|nr:obscurin-like protein 1 isoform X10 [Betta splendens]